MVSEPAAERPKAVAPASRTAKTRSQAPPRPAAPREETGTFARLPSGGAASARRNCRGSAEVTDEGSARVGTSPRGAGSGRVTAAGREVDAGAAATVVAARLVLTCDQPSVSPPASCPAVVSGDAARPSVPPCGRATAGAVVGSSGGWGWLGGTSAGYRCGGRVRSGNRRRDGTGCSASGLDRSRFARRVALILPVCLLILARTRRGNGAFRKCRNRLDRRDLCAAVRDPLAIPIAVMSTSFGTDWRTICGQISAIRSVIGTAAGALTVRLLRAVGRGR